MLAKAVKELPEGDLLYEPKWDGFRCIVFRDGDDIELTSRNDRPFTRYFPELLDPLRGSVPDEVFAETFVPPVSDGSGQDRNLLRRADESQSHGVPPSASRRRDL
jgi:hypothetical protein